MAAERGEIGTMRAERAVVIVIVLATALRTILAATTGLGIDESYMVGNARVLALGYLDHPPLHVWVTWLAVHVFGSEAPVFVRLPFIAFFAGSTWLMYRLSARLFGAHAGLWSVVAFNLAPVFTLSHASWVLPDGPAIFFLLATASVVARLLFDGPQPRRPLLRWLGAGILGGLALLSKYNAVFFVVAVLVYLVTVPAARRHLATPGPWLGAAVALIVFSPAIVWNSPHGMAGFAFQAGRIGHPSLNVVSFALNIGGQMLYLAPWLAVPLAISLTKALAAGRGDPRAWFLALAASGPIVVFSLLALWSPGLPHWQMPGWLFAFPLFGRDATALAMRRPQFARGYMAISAVLFAALLGAFAVQATRGGLIPVSWLAANPAIDPTVDLIDWRDLKQALGGRGMLGADTPVASVRWMYAGKVGYALGPDVPVLCVCDDARQFAFRYDQSRWSGRDVIVAVPEKQGRLWEGAMRFFDSLEPLPPVAITRNGQIVFQLDLKLGKDLHFPPK